MTKSKIHTLAAFFALLAIMIPFSSYRLVAGDEGFYVLAAKLVSQGKSLYTDFFYPQMPLIPWVYGAWMKLFGTTWDSARLLSAILTSALGATLFSFLLRYGRAWAWLGVLLFATNTLVFAWDTTVKTFTLSTLLLFGSYYLLEPGTKLNGSLRFLLAGFLFGLSVETRLFFAGLFPIFAFIIFQRGDPLSGRLKAILLFSLSSAIALLPSFYLLLKDFDVFEFNNLGYHLIRSDRDFESALHAKWTIVKTVLALRPSLQIDGIQFALLLVFGFAAELRSWLMTKQTSGAYLIAIGLFGLNLIPTPTYVQYFSTLTPFLIVSTIATLRRSPVLFVILSVVAYLFFAHSDLNKYMKSGVGVLGISPGEAQNKTPLALSIIGLKINKSLPEGAQLLAEWPGFLVDSHAAPWPNLENHFGWKVAHKIGRTSQQKMKIMPRADIAKLIRHSEPEFVLLERKSFDKNYFNLMNNYRLVWEEFGVMFFERNI